MKKLFIISLFILLFSGCYFVWTPTEENYICDAPYFADIDSIWRFCLINIAYKEDIDLYGAVDYWAPPDQTLANMAGDCEDKAILFAYIVYTQFNKRPEIIEETLDGGLHVYVLIGNTTYLTYSRGEAPIIRRWTYEEALWIAVHKHSI
jgi:hypothetical protein